MATAQCACGALRLTVSEPPQLTALCHCLACQRRTGAPFSAIAFTPLSVLKYLEKRQNSLVAAIVVAGSACIFVLLAVRQSIGNPITRRFG